MNSAVETEIAELPAGGLQPEPVIAPDPLVAANLYAGAAPDQVVSVVVVPFARALKAHRAAAAIRFWLLRSGKDGEHLALRIHAPAELADEIGQLLRRHAEDAAGALKAESSLLLTSYRRSAAAFGESPLSEDDGWALLTVSCLSASCDRMLASAIARPRQQMLLLELFAEAVGVMGWPSAIRAAYLRYHRDTLFRFLLTGLDDPDEHAARLLARCTQNVWRLRDPGGALAALVARSFKAAPPAELDGWQKSCRAAAEFLSAADSVLLPRFDPFAADRRFVPFFKVLHSAANQLGTRSLDEAQVCHLLLGLAAGDPGRAVAFLPDWEWADG